MRGENPFTLTFGQRPNEYINSRNEQIGHIINTFDMENAPSRMYMITGVRGSGKTVSLSEISDYYNKKSDWIVLRLSIETDIIEAALSEINRKSAVNKLGFELSVNLGVAEMKVNQARGEISTESKFRNVLEELDRHKKRVLFVLDEVLNNQNIKKFVGYFQIYITQHYPVYLVMAGLYNNISELQNDKDLTFLYRAPKIILEPLNIPAMATSYRTIFNLPSKEAVSMAKLTKGYPFAFQVLGYLKWETEDSIDKILPHFDECLTTYAYEKIWSELSALDQKVVFVISSGLTKTIEIRARLGMSPQLLNTYRKRLMERGVVNGSIRGELHLALPRFDVYIETYCESPL